MANANIFQQYLQAPRSVLDYAGDLDRRDANRLALEGQRGQNALQALTMEQARGQMADAAAKRNAIQRIYAANPGASQQEIARALQSDPLTSQEGWAAEKEFLGNEKTRSGISKEQAETAAKVAETRFKEADRHVQELVFVQTPQDVQAYVERTLDIRGVPPEQRDQLRATALGKFQQMGLEGWKAAAKQAAIPVVEEYKAAADMARAKLQSDTQITTNRLTNQTSRENSIRSTSQQERASLRADERQREANERGKVQYDSERGGMINLKTGEFQPATQGGQPIGAKEKPIPGPALKQITEARDNAATLNRLTAEFKPEFGGKGLYGLGAEMGMSIKGNVGVDKDAVAWWKNYRKQSELTERHALFGATLTQAEQGAWRSADIAPGMDAAVIERNLAERAALSKKVFENTRQDLIDAGYKKERIEAIADRNAPRPGATGDFEAPADKPRKYNPATGKIE